eukprot:scaffold2131_cov384-Prasinococcus_capsulatus_cf.AAC.6
MSGARARPCGGPRFDGGPRRQQRRGATSSAGAGPWHNDVATGPFTRRCLLRGTGVGASERPTQLQRCGVGPQLRKAECRGMGLTLA